MAKKTGIQDKQTQKVRAIRLKAKATTVRFHYIKSGQFRVIHVDGAHGGVTPNGNAIHMALFSERLPIPLNELYEVEPSGKLGKLSEKSVREGYVREIEVSAVLSLNTAKALHAWLSKSIDTLEKVNQTRENK